MKVNNINGLYICPRESTKVIERPSSWIATNEEL